MIFKKPVHPTVITIISLPAFILGGVLAGINWINLGQPEKGKKVIKYSIYGTLVMLLVIMAIPTDLRIKLWSVAVGINLGVGMALRKLQFDAYTFWAAENK